MNIAVMAYSYAGALERGETDLPQVIRGLRGMGIGAIELMHSLIRAEQLPAIREALAETRMSVVCSDVRIEYGVAALELAASLGARMVMMTPALDVRDPSTAHPRFCESLAKLLPLARKLGLTMTIENLGILAELYGRSEHALSICDQVGPELRVTFDAGNFLLAGEDSGQAFDRLASRIVHVHFKDWSVVSPTTVASLPGRDGRHYQGAALGEGVVDLGRTFQQLRQLGYAGTISVEYEGPQHPHEPVRRGVQYLRSLLMEGPPRGP